MGRKTITVSEETFEMLAENKDDGESWDKRLSDLQYATDKPAESSPDDLAALESSVRTIEERTGRIEKTLEDMGARR